MELYGVEGLILFVPREALLFCITLSGLSSDQQDQASQSDTVVSAVTWFYLTVSEIDSEMLVHLERLIE